MKRLRLEIDALAVESFATAETLAGTGTVRAHSPNTDAVFETCAVAASCGPNSCGVLICGIETGDCGTGAATCGSGGACPPPSGQMSCVGCTTYDYTAVRADSCDLCMSFYTDSPQRCPCI